jgi:hypothetical protein
MGAALIHADEQTDTTEQIGTFRDYANAPKNGMTRLLDGIGNWWERAAAYFRVGLKSQTVHAKIEDNFRIAEIKSWGLLNRVKLQTLINQSM